MKCYGKRAKVLHACKSKRTPVETGVPYSSDISRASLQLLSSPLNRVESASEKLDNLGKRVHRNTSGLRALSIPNSEGDNPIFHRDSPPNHLGARQVILALKLLGKAILNVGLKQPHNLAKLDSSQANSAREPVTGSISGASSWSCFLSVC